MLFETLATGPLARWAYTDAMPRVPITGTGFMPLLQWLVIPPLVLWFVGRQVDESSPGVGRKHEGR